MTPLDITVPFAFGLVSSLHCTQMCGPIVLSYSLAGRGSVASLLLYNLGRMLTYSVLGAVAGVLGNAMGLFGQLAGIEKPAMIVAGSLMLVAGVFMSGIVPKSSLVRIERVGVSSVLEDHHQTDDFLARLVGYGVLCGLLYAACSGRFHSEALGPDYGRVRRGQPAPFAIGIFSTAISARLGRWSGTFATVSDVDGRLSAVPGLTFPAMGICRRRE